MRETQVLDLCPPAHIARWDDSIKPALHGWLDSISYSDPTGSTGCVGLWRIRELPPPPPSPSSPSTLSFPELKRTTQIAYWLSLAHAERTAARSAPHKVLRHAYASEEGLASQLWSGVHVLDEGGFEALYIK